ncbi:IPT/TIG domain-containing protein [Streptomyces antibioticus]|uniref:IPT/TIG domain-containing protein n=1 Tax=Streptomyces antibioticus TaxID=1890 RepID=UPI0033FCF577
MAPTVSTVSPSQGPTSGGNTVTITGVGLTGATAVRFGTTPAASYTVNSSTQITAVAPARSAGSAPVTVVSPTGTSNPVAYTFIAAVLPSVTAVSPSGGPTSGGTTAALAGTGLTGATAVTFDGTPALSFTVNSATLITAVTPAGKAGAAVVAVTTPGGQSAASPSAYFFYAAPPRLHSATATAGPTAGGFTVTLTGSNLLNASAVLFGPDTAAYTVVSDTQINVTVPAGTGTAPITVITPGGTSNPLPFAYLPAPALTALVPAGGPTSSGTVITLTGTALATTTAVRFAMSAVPFTVVSDTQITATAPSGPAGPVSVTVTTQGGTSTGLAYTRVTEPAV